MRYTTRGKTGLNGVKVMESILHCDCGHSLTFTCEPKELEKYLKSTGGSVSSNGTTRCKACTQEHYAAVGRSIRSLP